MSNETLEPLKNKIKSSMTEAMEIGYRQACDDQKSISLGMCKEGYVNACNQLIQAFEIMNDIRAVVIIKKYKATFIGEIDKEIASLD